jgi:tRNA threonylcarbamoyladenosine biosynthesis protein TsaB
MYSLIIDSATKVLYIALVCDNKIVKEVYMKGEHDHAKNIVYLVDEALKTAKIEVDQLSKIIVGIGPGSYTGVRMGVTVSKMMASFKNVPLYKISTLKLIASGNKGIVLSMVDARHNQSFAAIIDTNKDRYILDEGMYDNNTLLESNYEFVSNESEFIVDPFYVISNSELVSNPDLLVPNYLRDTEAERNLK